MQGQTKAIKSRLINAGDEEIQSRFLLDYIKEEEEKKHKNQGSLKIRSNGWYQMNITKIIEAESSLDQIARIYHTSEEPTKFKEQDI